MPWQSSPALFPNPWALLCIKVPCPSLSLKGPPPDGDKDGPGDQPAPRAELKPVLSHVPPYLTVANMVLSVPGAALLRRGPRPEMWVLLVPGAVLQAAG